MGCEALTALGSLLHHPQGLRALQSAAGVLCPLGRAPGGTAQHRANTREARGTNRPAAYQGNPSSVVLETQLLRRRCPRGRGLLPVAEEQRRLSPTHAAHVYAHASVLTPSYSSHPRASYHSQPLLTRIRMLCPGAAEHDVCFSTAKISAATPQHLPW